MRQANAHINSKVIPTNAPNSSVNCLGSTFQITTAPISHIRTDTKFIVINIFLFFVVRTGFEPVPKADSFISLLQVITPKLDCHMLLRGHSITPNVTIDHLTIFSTLAFNPVSPRGGS